MELFQQGDVLMQQLPQLPAGAVAQPPTGLIILASGEATGHAHTIEETEGVMLYTLEQLLYLVADHEVTVRHQEHEPVTVPTGVYRIGRVQEYDYLAHEARRVRD